MCDWQWTSWDYDKCRDFEKSLALSEVINNLAMCGEENPKGAVISLLADGKLNAEGDWQWREYKRSEHYSMEGSGLIPASRWQTLLALQKELANVFMDESIELSANLVKLGIGETDKFYFDWREGYFSIADSLAGDWSSYREFWYMVQNIHIQPPAREKPFPNASGSELPKLPVDTSSGGRPAALDWEEAALEMAGRFYLGDFKPKTIAEVIREIQKWANRADGGPNENTVRPHAKRIFDAFNAWEKQS